MRIEYARYAMSYPFLNVQSFLVSRFFFSLTNQLINLLITASGCLVFLAFTRLIVDIVVKKTKADRKKSVKLDFSFNLIEIETRQCSFNAEAVPIKLKC